MDKTEKAKAVKLAFILIGSIMVLVGFNILSSDYRSQAGYSMSGFGIMFLGWSFSAESFLESITKPTKYNVLTKLLLVLAILVFSVGVTVVYVL